MKLIDIMLCLAASVGVMLVMASLLGSCNRHYSVELRDVRDKERHIVQVVQRSNWGSDRRQYCQLFSKQLDYYKVGDTIEVEVWQCKETLTEALAIDGVGNK